MRIYLDNAATTRPDPAVVEAMMPFLLGQFGNPSSTHAFGREAKAAIELSRKEIAGLIGASPSEIYFTSGGTEADNTALNGYVESFGIKTIITSPTEHHAVLHTAEFLKKTKAVNLIFLDVNARGDYPPDQLRDLLSHHPSSLVCLMHANNETGNLADIAQIASACREHHALFHSDTVQSVGKLPLNVSATGMDSIAGSAHKFHGPKGIGFLYLKSASKFGPLLHGGGQEKNLRSGTENVAGIVGMARALSLACSEMEKNKEYIMGLKKMLIERLKSSLTGIEFNGNGTDEDKSLYTILNISLPQSDNLDLLLFQLDLNHVAVSGGSACASGAITGSHVLTAMGADPMRPVIRFSLSKFNTAEDIGYAVDVLQRLVTPR